MAIGFHANRWQVVGQEAVQNQLYRAFKTFSRQGINNKLLLLHGPNGSAKTSIIHSLMAGLERYSHEAEGAIYSFAKMSDGERTCLIFAAEVVSAPPGSVFVVDEPELHLHRSIIVPLLKSLIETRADWARDMPVWIKVAVDLGVKLD